MTKEEIIKEATIKIKDYLSSNLPDDVNYSHVILHELFVYLDMIRFLSLGIYKQNEYLPFNYSSVIQKIENKVS